MAIRSVTVSRDAAAALPGADGKPALVNFPVVAWLEDRNMHAPGGGGVERVECRIMKAGQGLDGIEEGALLFVSRGRVHAGSYEEGRPWRNLVQFASDRSEKQYVTASELALRQLASRKSEALQYLFSDGGQVVLANFDDDRPGVSLHLNCADASAAEIANLCGVLLREFVLRRGALVRDTPFEHSFVWPKGNDTLETYDPCRPAPKTPLHVEIIGWLVPMVAFGAVAVFILWAAGVLRL